MNTTEYFGFKGYWTSSEV